MSSEEKAQEVEAVPIDAPKVPDAIDALAAEAKTIADRWQQDFRPRTPADEDDYRQAKRERQELRHQIGSIKDSRKTLLAPVKSKIREAEQRVADVTAKGDEMDAAYKAGLEEYEHIVVDRHYSELQAFWQETWPDAADDIDFIRVWNQHAHDLGWDRRTKNIQQMKQELAPIADGITGDLAYIHGATGISEDERTAVLADYRKCLDKAAAAGRMLERRRETEERQKRIDEQREWERQQREAEAHAQHVQEVAEAQRKAQQLDTGSVVTPDELDATKASIAGATYTAPEQAQQRDAEDLVVFEVTVPRRQMRAFIAAMKSLDGVHGHKTGTISKEKAA